jgi:ribosomal protein S18 acetylase RimI-like enzyme
MADATVRPAELDDAAAITALTAQLGYTASADDIRARLAVLVGDDRHAVFVAERGGQVVGWAHVADVPMVQDRAGADLEGIVVAAEERGSGVGRSLVTAAEEWARGRDLAVLRVRSRSSRQAAHAFYRRLGFEDVKTSLVFARPVGAPAAGPGLQQPA